MTLALITPPAGEPLSLAEAKEHLRVDGTAEDQLISEILVSARSYLEHASGQKLITQAWRQYEPCIGDRRLIRLRVAPVQSIEAVTIFDGTGAPRVLAANDYVLRRQSDEAWLDVLDAVDAAEAENGIEIDIVAGIGDDGTDVPALLKRAILLLSAHWYEFRGAVSPQEQPVSLPPGIDELVQPFKRARL